MGTTHEALHYAIFCTLLLLQNPLGPNKKANKLKISTVEKIMQHCDLAH
jgi:hypothetical protein